MYRPLVLLLLLLSFSARAQAPLPVDKVEQLANTILGYASQQQWQAAEPALHALRKEHPEFRPLPQLEALVTQRIAPNLAASAAIAPETDEFLPENLQSELLQRWHHRAPAPDMYPQPLLRMGAHQSHVFVVDLEKGRLYLYANEGGALRKLADYYSGIGKQGIGKQLRGDHRTPVGVYTLLEYIGDAKLPELYGAGALTLDYPNAWDRRLKRTGSGIWLHGVPRDTYSRTPRSSRGCVTVSNFIFDALRHYALPGQTPIVLTDRLEWRTADQIAQQRPIFDALLENWRGERAKQAAAEITLRDIDMYFYPGEQGLVQMNFKQITGPTETAKESFRTLYWRLQSDNSWKIIHQN
jgi:hypothetical protein